MAQVGQAQVDVTTPGGSSVLQAIALLYGASLSRELIHVVVDKKQQKDSPWTAEVYASNTNYQSKRFTLLLFINRKSLQPLLYVGFE